MATFFTLLFVFSITAKIQADCDGCINTLSACANSKAGTVSLPVSNGGPGSDSWNCNAGLFITVSASASANGCVTAYNNCITNQNCTCYPFAVLQVTSPTIKRVTTFRTKRRG